MWFLRRKDRESVKKADQALEEATQALRKTKRRDAEVNSITSTLREIREVNHFAETLLNKVIAKHEGAG